jgi:hypothetical protein
VHLQKLPELEFLNISTPTLQTEHLPKLAAIKSLRSLDIWHASPSPGDLEGLKQLKSLKYLEVSLGLKDLEELQKALPDCQIYSP